MLTHLSPRPPFTPRLTFIAGVNEVPNEGAVEVGKGEGVAEGQSEAHIRGGARDEQSVCERVEAPCVTLRHLAGHGDRGTAGVRLERRVSGRNQKNE